MSLIEIPICPAGDPTGTPVETLTEADISALRIEVSLNDLGEVRVTLPRNRWEALGLDMRESYYGRVKIPYIDNVGYIQGFWLLAGEMVLVDEDERGGETITIGGPGPGWILSTAVLNHEEWTDHSGVYVQDGKWYWEGKNYGQILSDLVNEDAASNHPALDTMETPGWDNTNDVDGTPWPQFGGVFSQDVGSSFLKVIRELQRGGELEVWVNPNLNLRAYSGAYGRDLSGNSYGAGVVRFVGSLVTPDENRNIIGKLTREKDGAGELTHVLTLGNDRRLESGQIVEGSPIHKWVTSPDYVSGDKVHEGFLSYETNSKVILERAGQRYIQRTQDRSARMLRAEVMPGQDEANGLYLPGAPSSDRGNYWIGDTVTWKTGGAEGIDLLNRDLRIARIRIDLDVAASDASDATRELSWRTHIETGDDATPSSSASSAINERSRGTSTPGCSCGNQRSSAQIILVGGTDDLEFGYLEPSDGSQHQLWRRSVDGTDVPIVLTAPIDLTTELTYYIQDHTVAGVKTDTDPSSGDYTAALKTDQGDGTFLYEWDDLNTGLNRNDLHVLIGTDTHHHDHGLLSDAGTHHHDTTQIEGYAAGGGSSLTLDHLLAAHRFIVGGHRGDTGNDGNSGDSWPENTEEGVAQVFQKAAILGMPGLAECDPRLNADGSWYLMHNASVDATTNGTGNVSAKTDAQMEALTIDGGLGYNATRHSGAGLKPGRLDTCFDLAKQMGGFLQLDNKVGADAATLAQFCIDQGMAERVIITAYSSTEADDIRAVDPRIHISGSNAAWDIDWYDNSWPQTEAAIVAYAPLRPLIRFDDPTETDIRNMWDRGVRAFTTNDIDFALGVVREIMVLDFADFLTDAEHSATDHTGIPGVPAGGGGGYEWIDDTLQPDQYPGSPDSLDDEFEGGGSIDGKWTKVNDPASGDALSQAVHTGFLFVGLAELGTDNWDNFVRLYQAPPAGSGAWEIGAKVSLVGQGNPTEHAEFATIDVYLGNPTDDQTVGSAIQINNNPSVTQIFQLFGQVVTAGSPGNMGTVQAQLMASAPGTFVYLKLQKVTANAYTSANTYKAWASGNGVIWHQIGSTALTFTTSPTEIGLGFRRPKSQTGTEAARAEALIDWFRRLS